MAPFVEEGQRVRADETVLLIEAGLDGVVKQVFPNNGDLVEFNQVFIVVTTVA
jgi:biotin carboxyl carrier protein